MPLRVLIVDDDPITVESVRRLLERAGHRVAAHMSGFGLVAALDENAPDVVLLDVGMPGLSGVGAMRAARDVLGSDRVAPRLILHSGRTAAELERHRVTLGADAVLRKPARMAEILRVVEETAGADTTSTPPSGSNKPAS